MVTIRPVITAWMLSVAAATAGPATEAAVFASVEVSGLVTGLAVDAGGLVYATQTQRSFGRGVVTADTPERQAADLRCTTFEQRKAMIAGWLKTGELQRDLTSAGDAFGPGDSFLTKYGERVVCLSDANMDGVCDEATLFAGPFDDGPASGICVGKSGQLWLASSPHLWFLADDDGDHAADRKVPAVSGYGIHCGDGRGGLQTVVAGDDGWIYFACGKLGCRFTPRDGLPALLWKEGGVFRCRADGGTPGREPELLATGLQDPAGLVIDRSGRIFVADRVEARTRLLQVITGGAYQEAALPAPVCGELPFSVSSIILAPEPWEGPGIHLLAGDATPGSGGIVPVLLKPSGSSFSVSASPPIWSGGAVLALAAAADGTLFFADWGGVVSARSQCRIRRLPPPPAVIENKGRAEGVIREARPSSWPALMEHQEALVRAAARDNILKLDWLEALPLILKPLRKGSSSAVRIDALKALTDLAKHQPELMQEAAIALRSNDPDFSTAALRILPAEAAGLCREQVLKVMQGGKPSLRATGAETLGRWRDVLAVPALISALEASEGDAFLQQACAGALARCAADEELAALRDHASLIVRKAAIHALAWRASPLLQQFFDDVGTQEAAVRAAWKRLLFSTFSSMPGALRNSATGSSPEFVTVCLAAAAFTGTPAAATSVAEWLERSDASTPGRLRTAALDTLLAWDDPDSFDPIEGRYLPTVPRPVGITTSLLAKVLPKLQGPPDDLKAKADEVLAGFKSQTPERLAAAVFNGEKSIPARCAALRQLAETAPARALETARSILTTPDSPALCRAEARLALLKLDPGTSYEQIAAALAGGSPPEKQAVMQKARKFDTRTAEVFWQQILTHLAVGDLDPSITVEAYEMLEIKNYREPRAPWRRIWERLNHRPGEGRLRTVLDAWLHCRNYGDPDKGGAVAFLHGAACMECHSLHGHGGLRGPALDGVGSRMDRTALLTSLVQPSAKIAREWQMVSASSKNRACEGLLRATPSGNILLTSEGIVPVPEAEFTLTEPVSPMPPVTAGMSERDIRDLVAWLAELK